MSSKIVSQIFKILFQTGDSNSFVLLGAFFSSYIRLKSSCSAEKKSAVESETHFCREVNVPKY